jgi:predicted site-specific integrase-resolvase
MLITRYKIPKTHLTIEEATVVLGVTAKTLYNWKCLGRMKCQNLGSSKSGRVRIPISEIERILGAKLNIKEA